jgi:hypothetical protein
MPEWVLHGEAVPKPGVSGTGQGSPIGLDFGRM